MWDDLKGGACDPETEADDDARIRDLHAVARWLNAARRSTTPSCAFAAESLRERAEDLKQQVVDYDDPDPPALEPKVEAAALELVAVWLESLP